MKFLKKNIRLFIGIIIGMLITGGVVYAVTSASDIGYTRTGTNITNVQEALNDLYSKTNNLTFGNAIHSETLSNLPDTTRTQQLEITKGKYLVIVKDDAAWYQSNINSISEPTLTISCASNNCVLNNIYKVGYSHTNNGNIRLTTAMNIYYAEIKEDTDTISYSYNFGASAGTEPKQVSLHAIPIN